MSDLRNPWESVRAAIDESVLEDTRSRVGKPNCPNLRRVNALSVALWTLLINPCEQKRREARALLEAVHGEDWSAKVMSLHAEAMRREAEEVRLIERAWRKRTDSAWSAEKEGDQ